ncbi:cytochrome P450, partial [Amycolatopsis sp. NPDC026612]
MDEFERHGIGVVSGRDAGARALRSAELTSDPGGGSPSLLLRDGEDHTRVRAVLREIIAGLEPLPEAVRASIEAVVDGLGPSFDLVGDFARPVAGAVTSAGMRSSPVGQNRLAAISSQCSWTSPAPSPAR